MNTQLKTEIQSFLTRASSEDMDMGEFALADDFQALDAALFAQIPTWYKEVLTQHPLAYQIVAIPHINPDFEGVYHIIEILGPEGIAAESMECYPGIAVFDDGYICIGSDEEGSGNPFFISIHEGDNPPVYQLEHGISEHGEEILAQGKTKIANSLSELFKNGEVL